MVLFVRVYTTTWINKDRYKRLPNNLATVPRKEHAAANNY